MFDGMTMIRLTYKPNKEANEQNIKYKCSKGQQGSRLQNNPTMNKMKTNTWPHSFNSKTYTLEDATLGMAWSCYAKTYNKCQYTKQKHTTTKIQSIRPNITIDAIPRRRRKLKNFHSNNDQNLRVSSIRHRWSYYVDALWLSYSQNFQMIWLSTLLTLSLSDDRHSTKASCALNFLSTFLLKDIRPLIRSAVNELNELTDNFYSHNALRNRYW